MNVKTIARKKLLDRNLDRSTDGRHSCRPVGLPGKRGGRFAAGRLAFFASALLLLAPVGRAQVATDGSFGAAGALPGPAFAIPASLGKKVGGNLFHSFSEFSINQHQSATFSGPAEVKNILARVTGGNISTIDGALKSEIAAANFFFLNPKGVLFGPNASVDVSGSFAVSTGDRITLGDGAQFKARASDPSDALLTSAPPAAFGFLGKGAGAIVFDGSQLPGPPDPQTGQPKIGGKWSLAGGDIQMKNGASLGTRAVVIRGGRLTMEGASIHVAATQPGDRADVKLQQSMSLKTGSALTVASSIVGPHLAVDIDAPSIVLANNSFIGNGGSGQTSAGTLNIRAQEFTLDDGSTVAGSSGDVRLAIAGNLTMRDGSTVQTNPANDAAAGNIAIAAGSMDLLNTPGQEAFTTGITANTSSAANAGEIRLAVSGRLMIANAAQISSETSGAGRGGSVLIHAGSVLLDGAGAISRPLISAETTNNLIGGAGGDVRLRIDGKLKLIRGGSVSAATVGSGDGGNVEIVAGSLLLSGEGQAVAKGINASSENGLRAGRGGDIRLTISGALRIVAGGTIAASTVGPGAGGNIAITAGRILLSGEGSTISATTLGQVQGGPGGSITIRTPSLLARDGATISTSTQGVGRGGSIDIATHTLVLDGASITADTNAPEKATIYPPISDLSITFDITQARDENLTLTLDVFDPFTGGHIALALLSGVGGSGSNFVETTLADDAPLSISSPQAAAPFTGRFKPHDRLSDLKGLSTDSFYILTIADADASDGTLLTNWSLNVNGEVIPADPDFPFPGNLPLGLNGAPSNASFLSVSGHDPSVAPLVPGKGGDVRISSDRLDLSHGARISALTRDAARGGDVQLTVAKQLQVTDQAAITASTKRSGQGGSVQIAAGDLLVSTKGQISASTKRSGQGGSVSITAGDLRVSSKGQISAATTGSGAGGNIEFSAASLALSTRGAISAQSTGSGRGGGIFGVVPGTLQISESALITASTLLSGRGGNISLTVGDLLVSTYGQISAATSGSGAGGDIEFSAASLALSSSGTISAQTTGTGKGGGIRGTVPGTLRITDFGLVTASTSLSGRGGNVSLTAGDLLVSSNGQISAATTGSGAGGNIEFSAANLALSTDGSISAQSTGSGRGGGIRGTVSGTLQITDSGIITASTLFSGRGGNVSLDAGDLFISTGGKISAATAGTGEGGTIDVNAKRIVISTGNSSGAALISAESTNPGMGGRGGDIFIGAGSLRIDGARDFLTGISARSFGAGDSGSVRLQLGTLSLDSSAFIGSSNTGAGKAGSVMVRADGDIFMRGGSVISTSAFQANAGDIDIASRTRIDLREGAAITASAGLNGGNITVAAPDFIHLIDSSITAIAGTTPSPVGGQGGNITIDPQFMVLDHSFIKADAAIGQGGNILLQTDNFLSSETSITATGTTAGTVEIVAPELDLSAALVILRGGLVDPSTQLREQCARRLGLDFSSFLVIGRGGVSLAPDDPLAETGPARKRQPAR